MSVNFPPFEHPGNTHEPEIILLLNDWRKGVYSTVTDNETRLDVNEGRLDDLEVAPAIVTPTLAGSWANFGGAYQTARYWIDQHGVVHLEGLVATGSGTIFTLNAGYRPANQNMFAVIASGALGRVDANSDGTVVLTTGISTHVQLSGITFLAA